MNVVRDDLQGSAVAITDQNVDYNKLDLEAGYFFNERWTAKVFAVGKKGNGYRGDIGYRHDQRAPHEYASAALGADPPRRQVHVRAAPDAGILITTRVPLPR